jgi:hypothetical protein
MVQGLLEKMAIKTFKKIRRQKMTIKLRSIYQVISDKVVKLQLFFADPHSQRGEESASVAAITGLVLLIILVIMAIFRNALITAFQRIADLLAF